MKRGLYDTTAELLEKVVQHPKWSASRVAPTAGVNVPFLKPVIDFGLLQYDDPKRKWGRKLRVTEKGRQFLQNYRALEQLFPKP
jgi:predicted transcriptional regulator